ncbi:MAG: energy-coupling factor transporter ATPase [Firmicutes bacterium]|nr:energy-coupling factor transporter ATPase [Bacillota bacterium]
MENIIEVRNLTFSYPAEDDSAEAQPTLKDLNMDIKEGEFVAIVGPNGSGKSTFAKCLNALLIPEEGSVHVADMDTGDEDLIWKIRSQVGMVFQNPDNQLVSSVVEDDVAFGPENLGVDPAEIRRRVDESLKAVNMYENRRKGPHQLSGGQKQRVAIAGVLAMQSPCMIFDEPTAMLDPSGRAEIIDVIDQLHRSGKTIVLITHFMEEAARADRIVVLKDGQLAMEGTPLQIFAQEDRLKEMKLVLPFAIELADLLRSRGIELPKDILNEDDLILALSAYADGRKEGPCA